MNNRRARQPSRGSHQAVIDQTGRHPGQRCGLSAARSLPTDYIAASGCCRARGTNICTSFEPAERAHLYWRSRLLSVDCRGGDKVRHGQSGARPHHRQLGAPRSHVGQDFETDGWLRARVGTSSSFSNALTGTISAGSIVKSSFHVTVILRQRQWFGLVGPRTNRKAGHHPPRIGRRSHRCRATGPPCRAHHRSAAMMAVPVARFGRFCPPDLVFFHVVSRLAWVLQRA